MNGGFHRTFTGLEPGRDCRIASRWRALSLARVLVAWAPAIAWLLYLASSPKVQGFVPTPQNPTLGALLTLAALGIGAVFTIARPERGPHDWLLGTWVVPR